MLFHTPIFLLVFLPVTWGVVRWVGRPLLALLVASLVFYAWWNPGLLPLLLGSILGNYLIGQALLRRPSRGLLAVGIAANLGLLGWFKYAGFLAGMFGARWDIALPLAISFFTFQQIMFLVESQGRARPDCGFVAYACFVAFFPHLIAGPIVRPSEVLPQLTAARLGRAGPDDVAAGLTRLLLGLGKKLILADSLAPFADAGFAGAAAEAPLSLLEAWVALLAFALQIYFDFSGYSDMAIGLARMFNVRFPENFDSPYQSESITEFWRRWHISLGQFLRGHLYIPLGGNRVGEARCCLNLLITMVLGGIWHGAGWNFLLWGGLHGGFLIVHRTWARAGWRLPGLAARGVTLLAVTLAWVPFRAEGWAACVALYQGLGGVHGLAVPHALTAAWPALAAIASPVAVLPFLGDARSLALPEALAWLGLGWFIVLVLPNTARMSERARMGGIAAGFALTAQAVLLAPHAAPFLYFQF